MGANGARRSIVIVVFAAVIAACSSSAERSATIVASVATTPASTAVAGSTASSVPDASTGVAGTGAQSSTSTEPPPSRPVSAPLAALPGPVTTESIGATLTASLATLHSEVSSVGSREQAGQMMQLALRALSRNSAWDDQVLGSLSADDREVIGPIVAARQVAAQRSAELGPRPPSPTLPAWQIVEPEPAADLVSYYREAEQLTGIGWNYLAASNLQETRMGRIVGPSSAGAQGPMQFLPSTWATCCVGDIHDPHDAIIGAARYLAASGGPSNMAKALNQYNPSRPYVAAVSAYAQHLAAHPEAYIGYHAWQVFVGSVAGDIRLPVGFATSIPIDASGYVASHPDDAAGP